MSLYSHGRCSSFRPRIWSSKVSLETANDPGRGLTAKDSRVYQPSGMATTAAIASPAPNKPTRMPIAVAVVSSIYSISSYWFTFTGNGLRGKTATRAAIRALIGGGCGHGPKSEKENIHIAAALGRVRERLSQGAKTHHSHRRRHAADRGDGSGESYREEARDPARAEAPAKHPRGNGDDNRDDER